MGGRGSRLSRRVPQPRVDAQARYGRIGDDPRVNSSLTYEVCAGEACTEHASEGRERPAGAQRRSQTRGWWAPAGQDTVETLKQAYFQGYPESAGCVQGSIDSRNSATHSAYRISLRPSSLFEPRHPSLKVVKLWSAGTQGRDAWRKDDHLPGRPWSRTPHPAPREWPKAPHWPRRERRGR